MFLVLIEIKLVSSYLAISNYMVFSGLQACHEESEGLLTGLPGFASIPVLRARPTFDICRALGQRMNGNSAFRPPTFTFHPWL